MRPFLLKNVMPLPLPLCMLARGDGTLALSAVEAGWGRGLRAIPVNAC
jgi:hypothetical protein